MELARLRLRGAYAIVAGALLLLVAPLYQSLALGPAYTAAITPIAQSRNFTPYLTWLMANLAADQTSRVVQTLPFLLALTLPSALSAWLWPAQRHPRLVALISGWVGFGAFVVAGLIGFIASAQAATTFQLAASDTARAAVASSFAQEYALQSLLSRGIGGIALAIFLARVSLRFASSTRLPRWVAYLGGMVAALEAANAVFFLLNPLNVQAPTASLSLAGLAVWLLVTGVALWQATSSTRIVERDARRIRQHLIERQSIARQRALIATPRPGMNRKSARHNNWSARSLHHLQVWNGQAIASGRSCPAETFGRSRPS